jgi:alpha-galactosidase/6-phospho-beta-glucosidase family protein
MVLTICWTATATADDPLQLQEVPAGYFLSESVANKMIEEYPELEQIFENAMKVESGSYMSDPVTIELGNKIEALKASENRYKEKYEVTYEALQEERQAVDEMKEADNKVIELQGVQIESWKKQYRRIQFQNTIEKAGLAVIIALFATN